MERATIAHAVALKDVGHDTLIITARPDAPDRYLDIPIAQLKTLTVIYPCDDDTLRAAVTSTGHDLTNELATLLAKEQVGAAVYVDALWGLGRAMPRVDGVRNVLAVHVVGHDHDLRATVDRGPDTIMAPSQVVLDQAAERGYDVGTWRVVSNTLLFRAEHVAGDTREQLRITAPMRIFARLGAEKGVLDLLNAATPDADNIEVALAVAPFETGIGSQADLRHAVNRLTLAGVSVRGALSWRQVPGWVAGAAAVIVPSRAETCGLAALEALAVGTPVIAYDVGNLPHLIGAGGAIVDIGDGPAGLWRAARRLLNSPVKYREASRAAYYRSRDYWPALVADQLLKVVS